MVLPRAIFFWAHCGSTNLTIHKRVDGSGKVTGGGVRAARSPRVGCNGSLLEPTTLVAVALEVHIKDIKEEAHTWDRCSQSSVLGCSGRSLLCETVSRNLSPPLSASVRVRSGTNLALDAAVAWSPEQEGQHHRAVTSTPSSDFDHLELFPTFDDNKVDVRKELELKLGKEGATEYIPTYAYRRWDRLDEEEDGERKLAVHRERGTCLRAQPGRVTRTSRRRDGQLARARPRRSNEKGASRATRAMPSAWRDGVEKWAEMVAAVEHEKGSSRATRTAGQTLVYKGQLDGLAHGRTNNTDPSDERMTRSRPTPLG